MPIALIARTLNLYCVPFINPVIVCVVAVELNVTGARGKYPMYGVTTYPVTGEPPFDTGAVHDTEADEEPPVATPTIGAPGTVAVGTTGFDEAE